MEDSILLQILRHLFFFFFFFTFLACVSSVGERRPCLLPWKVRIATSSATWRSPANFTSLDRTSWTW